MNKKIVKAGVIGIGSMGKNHLRILSELENVELVCVADNNSSLLSAAEKKYGVKTYSDFRDMLQKEKLDLVSVVVPTALHKEVALACLTAKVNVLLEKPIASNVAEAQEIIDAAHENNVILTIGHIERFNPAILELKRRMKAGEIGNIYKIEADRLGPYPLGRIKDCGVVIDLAVHDVDIFNFLLESDVKRVYAESEKKIHSTNEDLCLALLKFDNNVLGAINVNWLTPVKKRRLKVTGDQGVFEVDYINQDLIYYENASRHNAQASRSNAPFTISEGRTTKYFVAKREPLRVEIEHFVECIIDDKKPLVSPEDGLKALRLAEKIIESADKNEVLKIE